MIDSSSVRIKIEAAAISEGGCAVVGCVTETGDAATEWKDRRVIAPALTSCGECDFCRRGAPQGCADAVRLDQDAVLGAELSCGARYLAPCDGELEIKGPSAALLGSDGLRAYAAFCALGVAPAEPVVVLGSGARSELVRQVGKAKSTNVVDLSAAIETAAAKPWRAFVLEAKNTAKDDIEQLLAALPAGSNVAFSTDESELAWSLPLGSLAARGIAIAFVGLGHPDLLPELVALAARRELDLEACLSVPSPGTRLREP